ncbi:hypothetical protein S40285_07017, partial [Stachybotrys chlorohalonatus IBT 40285]
GGYLFRLKIAWTASAAADQEFRQALPTVEQSAEALANQIKRSKYFIAFTGARISTPAGLLQRPSAYRAIPPASHMALVKVQNRGFLKYLVSQNCDGLHRRSGVSLVSLGLVLHPLNYAKA